MKRTTTLKTRPKQPCLTLFVDGPMMMAGSGVCVTFWLWPGVKCSEGRESGNCEGTKFNLDLWKCIRFQLPQFVIMIQKSKRKFNFISFETFKIPKSNPVYWRSLGNFKEKPFKCQISLKFWNYDKIPQMKQAAPLTIHLFSLFVCKINVFLISHDWDLSPPPLCCVYSVNYFLRVY